MGIDINIYAERWVGGYWHLASPMEQNPHWVYDPEHEPRYKPADLYDGRNYALWAILGGIPNPANSVEPYQPVSLARGLPDNLSPELQLWVTNWNMDGPGIGPWSWLTLRELLEFDWYGKTILKQAQVTEDLAHLFQRDLPFPEDRWPADRPIAYYPVSNYSPGRIVHWTETYAESAGEEFMENLLPSLKELGAPDDIRIVFWFDW